MLLDRVLLAAAILLFLAAFWTGVAGLLVTVV
jgi:hypothetical protein